MDKSFEEKIARFLVDGNVMLTGLSGVGKSATALAISGQYVLQNDSETPAIVLSINPSEKTLSRIAFVQLDSKIIPITKVNISSLSTGDDVLNEILNSLSELHKNLQLFYNALRSTEGNISKYEATVGNLNDTMKTLIDNEILKSGTQNILEMAVQLAGALPYVGMVLRITNYVLNSHKENKLKDLERYGLLVVIDDISDLGSNSRVLWKLLQYRFHYLLVMRIDPEKYLSMQADKLNVGHSLRDIGIPLDIKTNIILPPPNEETFSNILDIDKVADEDIKELWRLTGGIPAIARIMVAQSLLGTKLRQLANSTLESTESNNVVYWGTNDINQRLEYICKSTKIIYDELKKRNYAYLALCVQTEGVAVDELALFCALSFGKLYTFRNKRVKELVELLSTYDSQIKNIQVLDYPKTGREEYDYTFSEANEFVERFSELWLKNKITLPNSSELVPSFTILPYGNERIVCRFDSLFQHIPILLNELAKRDDSLRAELQNARKLLLKVMIDHTRRITNNTNSRIITCAADHVNTLCDFETVEESVAICGIFAYAKIPDLGLKLPHEKVIEAAKGNNLLLARLLLSMSEFVRDYRDEPTISDPIAKQVVGIFERMDKSDRLISMFYLRSMAQLAFQQKRNGFALMKNVIQMVDGFFKESQDSLSLYLKAWMMSDIIDFYLGHHEYERCKMILDETENILEKLITEYSRNPQSLDWIREKIFYDPELEIMGRISEHLLLSGTVDYALDDLDKAGDSCKKGLSLRVHDDRSRILFLRNQLVADLLNNKGNDFYRVTLWRLAKLDMNIATNSYRPYHSTGLSPDELLSTHLVAVLARGVLGTLYRRRDSLNQKYEYDVDVRLIRNSYSKSVIYLMLYCLQKLAPSKENEEVLIDKLLSSISELPSFQNVSKISIALYSSTKTKPEAKSNPFSEGNKKDLKTALVEELETLPVPVGLSGFFLIHRNTAKEIILESILSILLAIMEERRDPIGSTLLLLVPAVYDDYFLVNETAYRFAVDSNSWPLHKRIFRELFEASGNMIINEVTPEYRLALAKALTRAFVLMTDI